MGLVLEIYSSLVSSNAYAIYGVQADASLQVTKSVGKRGLNFIISLQKKYVNGINESKQDPVHRILHPTLPNGEGI